MLEKMDDFFTARVDEVGNWEVTHTLRAVKHIV